MVPDRSAMARVSDQHSPVAVSTTSGLTSVSAISAGNSTFAGAEKRRHGVGLGRR